jgi:hypothetical protein
MAITQAICNSFKQQLLEGAHDLRNGQDTINIALYQSSATLDSTTTAYTATGEASGTGYSAGGQGLANVNPTLSGSTAVADFADEVFSGVTITVRGALIYNTTPTHTYTNPAIVVLDFGTDISAISGDLTIQFPTADASNAIIRLT